MRYKKLVSLLILLLLITVNASLLSYPVIVVAGDPPAEFNNTENLGYELLDNGSVFHMWNNHDSYYFNRSNGIQFTNHYQEFWTRNIFCIGYYNNDEWNIIKCADELSGFNKNITGERYCSVTFY